MKRWLLIGGGILLLAVIIILNLRKSNVPSVEAKTAMVEVGEVTSRVSAPGRVRAVSSVDISAEVPGRIVELAVAEGDSVIQDQLLLRLDDAQYQSRVAQVWALLRSSQANLALSEARLEKFKNDKDRLEALKGRDLASEQAVEQALTDYRVQTADVEAKRQDVARQAAALIDAKDNLQKTVYKAPVSGVVSRLNIEEGEIVITGTMNNPGTVILTIADLSHMEVEAEVDETDVVSVLVGQNAEISVDAIPDTTFEGTVVTVGNSGRRRGTGTNNEVINFEVKVRFDHGDIRLKPGMTADIVVETQTRSDVLIVPIQSLVARSRRTLARDRKARDRREGVDSLTAEPDSMSAAEKKKWEKEVVEGVYAVVDDQAVFVPIEVGIADDTRIEVRGELSEGDVLVSGPYKVLRDLKEGTRVKKSEDESDEG